MKGYYTQKLAARQLRKCYELAPPRTRQYLRAEMDFVLSRIKPGAIILDLGCGYGRTLPELAAKAGFVVGIDKLPPCFFWLLPLNGQSRGMGGGKIRPLIPTFKT